VTTVLLDTHVLHWSSAEPERLSTAARDALVAADELAVASVTWYELAWLALHERIRITRPLLSWLDELAGQVRTVVTTPSISATAVSLPSSFPSDPADRLIYATAIEHGWRLVTKDDRLRLQRHPREITVW
jgi:PIN domain nuclease of toxin-antitoxin system